jgi:hypothetical protein
MKPGGNHRKPRRSGQDPEKIAERAIDAAGRQTRVFKRTLVTESTISTGATGYLGVLNAASSANATSAVNWGSYSAIAQEYRVLAIELEMHPIVNAQTTATTPSPTVVYACSYSSDDIPSAYQQVAQGPGGKTFSGYRPIKFAASSKGFPGAKLFVGVGAAIATNNTFGIMAADSGTVPASTASTAYFRATIRYVVEFRSFD